MLDYLKNAFLHSEVGRPYNDELINLRCSYGFTFDKRKFVTDYSHINDFLNKIRAMAVELYFHSPFMELIIRDCKINNWVDIENLYFIEIKRLSEFETRDGYLQELNALNDSLNKLRDKLFDYLKELNSSINIDFKSDQAEKFLEILGQESKQSVLKNGYADDTLVLNFNYTDTVSKYLMNLGKRHFKEIKIHGNMREKNSIIFGYGDEMDDAISDLEKKNDNLFFTHLKSFGYFKNSDYQEAMNFLDSEEKSINVHIIGHSLGLSDRILLNQIFEHNSINQIKIYYHKSQNGEDDFINKTHEISRHFKNKSLMRKIIIPFTYSEAVPQKNYSRLDG